MQIRPSQRLRPLRPLRPLFSLLLGLAAGCDDGASPGEPQGGVDQAAPDMRPVDMALDRAIADMQPVDMRPVDMLAVDMRPADMRSLDMQPGDMQSLDMQPGDMLPMDLGAPDMKRPLDMQPVDRGPFDDMAPLPDLGDVDGGAPLGPHGIDSYDPTCQDPAWVPGQCGAGMGERHDSRGAQHIPVDVAIEYDLSPPCADNHRGQWANWGQYRSLPAQRWLHNLEHGGIAILYHPCAPAEVVTQLRDLARARGDEFRWILAPYPELQSAVALVAWEWRYFANCVRPDEINLFFDQRHAMGPEDVGGNGGYSVEWLGR